MSLSWGLTLLGATSEALAEADRAEPALEGHLRARMQMQRALILQRLGRLDEAVEGYRRPLSAFRRAGDALWEARLLCNRGVLQVYRGALNAAEADFLRAEPMFESLGQPLAATMIRHNLGWVAARRGDVPAALEWYDRVEAEYREHDVPLALLLMDRCEVLLSARLATEARENAEAAVAELEAAGMGIRPRRGPPARRPGGAARGRSPPPPTSTPTRPTAPSPASAARAGRRWRARRPRAPRGWSRTATTRPALEAAQRAIRALDAVGWGVEALDARLIAGRAALELGRPRLARRQLALAAAARGRGPVQVRTRAWHAAALLRLSHGDRRGASAAVAAGLRALEAHRMTLGATELRAHASGHGEELATLGLRLAVESGSAARVLAAAERRRAAGLLLPPRATARRRGARRRARRPAPRHRRARRVAARRPPGPGAAPPPGRARALGPPRARCARGRATRARRRRRRRSDDARRCRALAARCSATRSLVEFFALDGRLHAVTVADGRARCTASATPPRSTARSRRCGSACAAWRRRAPGSRAADSMADVCATVAARLDALLLEPLRIDAIGRSCSCPTGELHALPWSMLPSLAHRPVAVAPSLRLWFRAARHADAYRPHPPCSSPARACPPRREEIETLRARHPDALALTGDDATVAQVAQALDGADSAHLAAHGRFRDDNPLFCSLELADGALTVYDLERLRRAPRRLVLSSCESGLSSGARGRRADGLHRRGLRPRDRDRDRRGRAGARRGDRGADARARRRAARRHAAGRGARPRT